MAPKQKGPKEGAKRKPEGRAQVAQRQATIRARRRAEGRVPLQLWPLAEHVESIRAYAAQLEAGQAPNAEMCGAQASG